MQIIYFTITIVYFFVVAVIMRKNDTIRKTSIKYRTLLLAFLILAFIVRIYEFDKLPNLDLDEAMGGINSWSLGKYGVDYFHLAKNPVYLYAWGSGMNILYPLIAVPFVKFLGLSIVVYRLPLIIVNLIAILLLTYSLYKTQIIGNIQSLILLVVIFLSPVTICASRWAIESNLFIPLVVVILSLFILFIAATSKFAKNIYLVTITLLLGLSAYCYSNNWIFLFSFVICFYPCFFIKGKINIKQILGSFAILLIECLPLILFLYVNFISKKEMSLGGFTATKLATSRSAFAIEKGHLLASIINNLTNSIKMLINGYDGIPKITPQFFGAFLPLMLAFCCIGIITYIVKEKSVLDTFMFIMLISALWNLLLIQPNFTHFNAIIVPILYFEAKGIIVAFDNDHSLTIFMVIFILLFVGASKSYINDYDNGTYNNYENTTPNELKGMINQAASYNNVFLVSSHDIRQTNSLSYFVLPIFYQQINPYKFHRETPYAQPSEFMTYNHFGKWNIVDLPINKKLKSRKRGVYIVQNGIKMNKASYKTIQTGRYYTMYYFEG